MKPKQFLSRQFHFVIFALFLLFHAANCFFTVYFGDDYYYAAFIGRGWDYFWTENVFHYLQTNGRALVHLLDELLLGFGFLPWQLFNLLTVAALAIGMAKIAAQDDTIGTEISSCESEVQTTGAARRYQYALPAVCSLLTLFDVPILRQSVYWATGSLNYLFPVTCAVWFYLILSRSLRKERGSIWLPILAFFLCFTVEQASVAVFAGVAYGIVIWILRYRSCPKPTYLLGFGASLAGMALLFGAPGNQVRMTYYPAFYAMSLTDRILSNLKPLYTAVFGRGGMYAVISLAFLTAFFCAVRTALRPGSKYHRIAAAIMAILTLPATILYPYMLIFDLSIIYTVPVVASVGVAVIAIMTYTVWQFFALGKKDDLYFVFCAVGLQLAMLLSPEIGPRTVTISAVFLSIPIARRLAEAKSALLYLLCGLEALLLLPGYANHTVFAIAAIAIAVVLVVYCLLFCNRQAWRVMLAAILAISVCLGGFATVTFGYAENMEVHRQNRLQITQYLASDRTEPLTLYYLRNDIYKYTMPYDDIYHQHVLLKLVGLPTDTEVIYLVFPG